MTITFDKRLAELDAYLQMLIEQNELLDTKIDSTINEGEKDCLRLIKTNLENLLASIKHAIVLLQIAKVSIRTDSSTNSLTSISSSKPSAVKAKVRQQQQAQGSPQPPARAIRQAQPFGRQQITTLPQVNPSSLTPNIAYSNIQPSSRGSEGKQSTQLQHCVSQNNDNKSSHGVDMTSSRGSKQRSSFNHETDVAETRSNIERDGAVNYGSDQEDIDDDTFYDAAELNHNSPPDAQNINNPATQKPYQDNTVAIATTMPNINNNNDNTYTNNSIEDGSIDWDSFYEEEEEDLGSLENQGSVIRHLLSQIRIGMDLTKVVLPTFILERRSLLEMYADFFAHPDLFSSIPDYDSSEERMVQIVKWYLSAFHAGRKSSLAKKPYNPILGEIFLCHWNLNGENDPDNVNQIDTDLSQDKNEDLKDSSESSVSDIEQFSKQLPKGSLIFVSEQVSHHPPVSAFYAENSEKGISCCAHIYTKSKYLGLSVGVHNLGKGVISLSRHNETYVCTFPSAYGRSILTVPWIELGGSVSITCEQSGYSANIEFVTKPFYGGKKHRVTGEILRPNEEVFLSIEGEWNGCFYSKSPPNSNEKQVFVDTTSLQVLKKKVRSISCQESFESRNVWKEVTRALKLHDVNSATAAKSYIEQRQRDLLKDRTEKGIKWKTRYFIPEGEGWSYAKPLAGKS